MEWLKRGFKPIRLPRWSLTHRMAGMPLTFGLARVILPLRETGNGQTVSRLTTLSPIGGRGAPIIPANRTIIKVSRMPWGSRLSLGPISPRLTSGFRANGMTSMRTTNCISLLNMETTRPSKPMAVWRCVPFRGWAMRCKGAAAVPLSCAIAAAG